MFRYPLTQKILAPDRATSDVFGASMAAYGNTVVMAAPGDDDYGSSSGAAYVFVFNPATEAWAFQQKLYASDSASGYGYGCSVAIYEDTIVVGSNTRPNGVGGTGAIYVYKRTGTSWAQTDLFVTSYYDNRGYFGTKVAVSADWVMGYEARVSNLHSVIYLYKKNEFGAWIYNSYLTRTSGYWVYDGFGREMCLKGNILLVAINGYSGYYDGVYVYEQVAGSWLQTALLRPTPVYNNNDGFGLGLAIRDDNFFAIGAPMDNNYGVQHVYTFEKVLGTWTQQQIIVRTNLGGVNNVWHRFGDALDFHDTGLFVGAYQYELAGTGTYTGALYHYDLQEDGSYDNEILCVLCDRTGGDQFGKNVWCANGYVLSSAAYNDPEGMADAGAIYCYQITDQYLQALKPAIAVGRTSDPSKCKAIFFDGTIWSDMGAPAVDGELYSCYAYLQDYLMAVGTGAGGSAVLAWDGIAWTDLSTAFQTAAGSATPLEVAGSGPTNIYIVCNDYCIYFFNGSAFSKVFTWPHAGTPNPAICVNSTNGKCYAGFDSGYAYSDVTGSWAILFPYNSDYSYMRFEEIESGRMIGRKIYTISPYSGSVFVEFDVNGNVLDQWFPTGDPFTYLDFGYIKTTRSLGADDLWCRTGSSEMVSHVVQRVAKTYTGGFTPWSSQTKAIAVWDYNQAWICGNDDAAWNGSALLSLFTDLCQVNGTLFTDKNDFGSAAAGAYILNDVKFMGPAQTISPRPLRSPAGLFCIDRVRLLP